MTRVHLSSWEAGHEGIVTALGNAQTSDRLRELGVVPGAWVKVIQPGSPMLIQAGDSRICLRREDAKLIEVETIPCLTKSGVVVGPRALPA